MKHLNQNKMGREEFFKAYGHRLVNVLGDDTETGSFQLFSPEETHLAFQYQRNGFEIASVFEKEDGEDYIVLDNDASTSHHKIGYLILTPKQNG